jgi:hypothetical protein
MICLAQIDFHTPWFHLHSPFYGTSSVIRSASQFLGSLPLHTLPSGYNLRLITNRAADFDELVETAKYYSLKQGKVFQIDTRCLVRKFITCCFTHSEDVLPLTSILNKMNSVQEYIPVPL